MTGAKDQMISQESSYFLLFTSAFCYAGSVFRHILMSGRKHVSQDVWAYERSLAFIIPGVRFFFLPAFILVFILALQDLSLA